MSVALSIDSIKCDTLQAFLHVGKRLREEPQRDQENHSLTLGFAPTLLIALETSFAELA